MRPNRYHPTRVAQVLIASSFILTALLFPVIYRAAEPLLVGISVTPAAPTIFAGQNKQFTATLHFNDGSQQTVTAPTGTWSSTGSLAMARYYHTATRLQDGSVLVVGGTNGSFGITTAERYNPVTGLWTPAGTTFIIRAAHTATLLPNGKVLVVGGINTHNNTLTDTTQLYDPGSNSWSMGPPLLNGNRAFHAAVALQSGDVLVTAGLRFGNDCTYQARTEIYDWANNSWKNADSLNLARSNATAILLDDGRVLLAGGPANNCPTPNVGLNQAEIYDVAKDDWSVLPNLSTSRYNNFIASLPDGKVLLAGGINGGGFTASADVFTPSATGGTFSLTAPMAAARATSGGLGDNGATVSDGQVLVAGGSDGVTTLSSAELFNPATSTWSATGGLLTARVHNTITPLDNGLALVVGGHGVGGVALASAEVYQPEFIWASSDPNVATIDQTGQATAHGPGITTITATSGSIIGSITLKVEPRPVPTASFTANPNPAACGQDMIFDATLSHAAPGFNLVKYEWDFGDNTTATGFKVSHAYASFGSYTATLTVTDDNTPPNTDATTVAVNVNHGNRAPIASHGGPYLADVGAAAFLNGSASTDPDAACGDSIVSYSWSINNGAITLNGASPSLSAAQVTALGVGSFPVSLTVTDEFGATNAASTTLAIYNNVPRAAFTAMPNPAACGQPITFNGSLSSVDRPDRAIVKYEWSFGDNTTGTGATATHAYAAFGTYSAMLTVTDNNVPPRTDSTTVLINVNQGNRSPIAHPGGPYDVDLGLPVSLDGTASTDPDLACGDSITNFSWSINNGAVKLNGATPALLATQIVALGAGTFPVLLTVTDEFGQTSTASTTLSIYNNVPTAAFTAMPNPAACGQSVTFNGSLSSIDRPGRAIVKYEWSFGDNTTGTGATATHAYAAFGTYIATLTVTDDNTPPRTDVRTIPIAVNQGNLAPFANAGGPYSVNAGGAVQLSGAASTDPNAGCGDQIVSYEWNVGGIQLAGVSPTLNTATTPLPTGIHNVTLTVRDSFGVMASASTTINVQRVLVSIAVTPTPLTLSSGQQQMFTATGTFSDGSTAPLMSSGGGSSPPSFGPNDPTWQVQFLQGANFSVCSTPQFPLTSSFTSQNLLTRNGQVDMHWSPGTPVVEVKGTVTLNDVALTLACTNGAAFGTLEATWTGTRYEGQLYFNNGATQSDVTLTGWSRQAPMTAARFGLTALAHGGKVYAIGGTAGACTGQNPCPFAPLTTVEAYDPASDSWSLASPLNHGREGGRAIVLGNRWFVIGGHTSGGQASGVVEVLDPAGTGGWSELASDPMPTPRANFVLVSDGTYLYAIGGDTTAGNGGTVATVERFDPAAPAGQRWTTLAPMPIAGHFIGAGVLNGTIVVVGAGGTNRTDIYTIATNTWSQGVPMPAQRTAMASAVANGGLWLIGGTTNGALNFDSWVYYPATPIRPEGWAGVGSMPTGRSTPAAAVIGDVVYAVGGANASNIAVAANEALSTPPFPDLSTSGSSSGGSGNTVPTVQWLSTNPSAATIDGNGNAVAKSAGQSTIVATAGNISCQTAGACALLTVANTVPAVQIFGGSFTPNESANFQNFSTGGNFTDPDQQSWTATVDYGDGTGIQPLMLSNLQNGFTPTGQFNLLHRYADSGVFTVTVTIDDQAGGIGIATRQVTINNLAPQVFGPMEASTNVGGGMSFGCVSFSDVPVDAPWTATVDYGDGSGAQPVALNVPGSCGGGGSTTGAFSLSHLYSSAGNFTIVASVTDKDGATGMRSFPVVVNAAPEVTIDNTPLAVINEGSTFTGTASFTDAMNDGPWTVRINYGDNTGQSQSMVTSLDVIPLSHTYGDNGSYMISVEVQDKFFQRGKKTATLMVNNVAPVVNALPSLSAITEGQQVNFTINYSDPGFNDNQSPGFRAEINWGDGSALQTMMNVPFNNGTGNFFVNHTYRDNPAAPETAFTITVTVRDKDGGTSATQSTQLVVNNAPPSAQLNSSPDLVQGVPATFSGQLFDQGPLDAPWSGEVDFGDGVVQPLTFALNPQGQTPRGTFSFTHAYQQSGPVTLTLRATDKDGTTGTRTFEFHVDPVMVSVAITPTEAWLNAVGQTLQFNGSALFSDGSTHQTNGEVVPGVTWSSSNHAVALISDSGLATATGPGVTTITLHVEDDLGHQFTADATLRVDVMAPAITADDITVEAASSSGAAVTLVFAATDDFDVSPTVVADHSSGLFPIGATDVIVTATDAAGNTSSRTIKVTVEDTTAPSITVPADITVDATSPQGATVNYSASATDAVSANIVVTCLPPSGSIFPIGTTTVPCTATDAAGNSATADFTVLVQAAAAQVTQLMATVQDFNLQQGIANSLDAKLEHILGALTDATAGNTTSVCNQLGAFINETQAQSGKKLTEEQAIQLIMAAQQIRAVIGCQ